MFKLSYKQKTVSVQLGVAFAQVTFGIAIAALFNEEFDLFKMFIILINILLTILFSYVSLLLIEQKNHYEYSRH